MRKKAFILLLVIIIFVTSSCQTEEPVTPPEERDANITEYGVIAEIYYDTFEEPKDKENVQNILSYNGFEFKNKHSDDRRLQYETYEKTKEINGKTYNFIIDINYNTKRDGKEVQTVQYYISTTNITIYEEFYSDSFEVKLLLSEQGYESFSISLLTNEIIWGYEVEENPLYQNYLNGDYDAQITEMETIMDEELQPLPEDYVAPSTTK